ncbi:aminoglycoside phosphotransferase family protein [Paeniglutamicibacter gangotriensis]|uniref:Aminoglycoside phosphotransferase n=1 Tax=Paeniglutamicibacter gangotriensis Lz1y TaxID=1276920 RepID=M7MWK7_9MICC|nr:aminoglycoside phosphotransferase family protein [Paeniglutamicibacter gangotriensis]EMQ99325.1 aminoglycoside phosphotransferase [Paeniglutamicibacter gangotriensis Lz1y]
MNAEPAPPPPTRPAADVHIDGELVQALLRAQCPELAGLGLEFLDDGWDNVIYRLGPEYAVRLPRRESAHVLLLREVRWLPFLAPRLPLPVPVPVHRGKPGEGYPYHWAVMRWLPGISAASVPAVARDGYASTLAAFFRALHVPAPADAPVNPVRGVPLRDRDLAARTRMEAVAEPQRTGLLELWEQGLAAPERVGPRLWLHGDPHPHNMLISGAGKAGPRGAEGLGQAVVGTAPEVARLEAVIDFGDLTAGDPASDLAVAWLHFTPQGRRQLRAGLERHGLYSAGIWERARAWAVNYAVLMSSLEDGDPLREVGIHGIEQLLDEG